ncbi:protein FAM114A2 [Anopheles maculipalpis]|uniref:protein FAM114A2 n=1 Tax=Anopheles maculipalpis TaxID=1496333 RepID=UPI002158C26F|nr:protein FAM114A2 [Anopheles maculipalpis]
MCDSDSEEFASADEDFEEIEPDELEEVLQSTKPSDVSSKKKEQLAAPASPTKSDVEPVSKSKGDQLEDKTQSLEDSASCPPPTTTSTVTEVESENKIPILPKIEDYKGDTLQKDQVTDSKTTKEDKEKLDTNASTAKYVEKLVTLEEKVNQEPSPSVQSCSGDEKSNETANKSKKLVLKPAKPQLLEQIEKQAQEPESKIPESGVTEGEGWDDFDDDWGDFPVEGSNTVALKVENKQPISVNANTSDPAQPSSAKATSFRDVDIDEVEHKLKDFMKHKDDPPLTSVLDRLSSGADNTKATADAGQSWGSWKPSWGGAAVSFLSNASKSVATITTNITQVIESGIGVPNPEEMARRQAEAEAKLKAEGYLQEEPDIAPSTSAQSEDRFGFDQLVSGVTQISSKVITGGLDTLEGIGKKTMTILQENDPGLLNKRKLLGLQPNDGVVLSQVLREAKAKTEERERNLKQIQKHQYKKKLHFETLFDDYHGLVHLEALEMLSKQASLKLESLMAPLTGKALDDLQETMSEVKELCELPETDNDDADGLHTADELQAKLLETIVDLNPNVKVDFGEIVKSWTEYTEWIADKSEPQRTGQDVFEKAMHALAQTTALCVLRMHKLAEILLISDHHSTATEADVLVQLTSVFCWHLSGVATRFCSELTKMKDESGDDSDSALITNIFLEGSNSTSYVQNAFHLFIPILQLGAA